VTIDPIVINKDKNIILPKGSEINLLSITPTMDNKSGTYRPDKVCMCFVPLNAFPLEDQYLALPANKLILVEGYDDLNNNYSNERCDEVYNLVLNRNKDRKIITFGDMREDI
jgi:hypothetical protein